MNSFKHSLILATLTLAGGAALADDITMIDATPSVRSRDAVLMELRQAQADGSLQGGGELALTRTPKAMSLSTSMSTAAAGMAARSADPRLTAGRLLPAQFAMLYGAP